MPVARGSQGHVFFEAGAMFINEQFIHPYWSSRLLGPSRHCLGPTNAFRSEVLAQIGGFEALAPHLADDYMLGNFVAAAGLRVVLSRYFIQTIVSDPTLRRSGIMSCVGIARFAEYNPLVTRECFLPIRCRLRSSLSYSPRGSKTCS